MIIKDINNLTEYEELSLKITVEEEGKTFKSYRENNLLNLIVINKYSKEKFINIMTNQKN